MSVLSTLALLVTAAFRPKLEDHRAHKAEVARLARELAIAKSDRDYWREVAMARRPEPFDPRMIQAQLLQHQAQMNLQHSQAFAQHQAQMQQNAYAQVGILGAQSLGLAPELWCNCVPSRAQMWAAQPNG